MSFFLFYFFIFISSSFFLISSSKFPVAFSTDKNFFFPTVVSVESVCGRGKDENEVYDVHIIISKDVDEKMQSGFKKVGERYRNCNITLHTFAELDPSGEFEELLSFETFPHAAYYRLFLPDIITYADKILYLDGDTLTYSSLSPLFSLDIGDNYFMGNLDEQSDDLLRFGIINNMYINSGILVMNAKKLREDKALEKMKEIIKYNKYLLIYNDQTVINLFAFKKTAILPWKYGTWRFESKNRIKEYVYNLKVPVSLEEIEKSNEKCIVIHFVGINKPWKSPGPKVKDWWEVARNSDFYEDIRRWSFHRE